MPDIKKCLVCDCEFSPPFEEYTLNMCVECYTRVYIQLQIEKALIPKPIDMILYCPTCGTQHIDVVEPCTSNFCESGCCQPDDCIAWMNPPHKSHLCKKCAFVWRPADVPTNGVLHIKTKGENDNRTFSRNAQPAKGLK